jgi:polar amino acid transport system permease protein
VSFFRGTPLFVQILLIHFAVLPLFINPADGMLISGETARNIKQNYGAFLSGIVALTLNAGAYISEIFRAGIQSIDKGQVEASRSLGMSFRAPCSTSCCRRPFAACCRRWATTPSRC